MGRVLLMLLVLLGAGHATMLCDFIPRAPRLYLCQRHTVLTVALPLA